MSDPKIEMLPTDTLVPYARNSRTHSDEQVAQIMGSIKEFGFTNPVLIDADGVIIAGHGRIMAATRLGLKQVPCIRLGHLSESQKRAYVIADNRLALSGGWDNDMLRLEIEDLKLDGFDLDLLGFDDAELGDLLGNGGGGVKADSAISDIDKWHLVIEYDNEAELAQAYEQAMAEGLKCKIMS